MAAERDEAWDRLAEAFDQVLEGLKRLEDAVWLDRHSNHGLQSDGSMFVDTRCSICRVVWPAEVAARE